tara:strand:- start:282 stop:1229 length:948 start_codon:yes stop_codon:yes gene_type:complete
MGRAQVYYPANELSEPLFAQPGEFVDSLTLEPYVGPYVEAAGQYIAGTSPRLGDPVLKRIADLAGEKFRQPISSEYYTLTRREFDNHYVPIHRVIEPDFEDYEDGSFMRYFAQKINEPEKISEIDEEQSKQFNRENKVGPDSRLYHKIEMRWFLTGRDASQNNKVNIQIMETKFPGISKFLDNPNQYVRIVIENERTYSDGTVISANLPNSFGVPQQIGQACMNCKFRHNNYCSKWRAQIQNNYWCQSWKMKQMPLPAKIQNNLYTNGGEYLLNGEEYIGDYHIHPDKGAMVGANHINQPHAYLTPLQSSEQSPY